MSKLSWQFVVITCTAIVGIVVTAFLSHEAVAAIIGGIALIYGQAISAGKSSEAAATGLEVKHKQEYIEMKTEDAVKEIKEVKVEAKKIAEVATQQRIETSNASLAAIEEIHVATNSMKDAQIDLADKLGQARGEKIGRTEKAAEIKQTAQEVRDMAVTKIIKRPEDEIIKDSDTVTVVRDEDGNYNSEKG